MTDIEQQEQEKREAEEKRQADQRQAEDEQRRQADEQRRREDEDRRRDQQQQDQDRRRQADDEQRRRAEDEQQRRQQRDQDQRQQQDRQRRDAEARRADGKRQTVEQAGKSWQDLQEAHPKLIKEIRQEKEGIEIKTRNGATIRDDGGKIRADKIDQESASLMAASMRRQGYESVTIHARNDDEAKIMARAAVTQGVEVKNSELQEYVKQVRDEIAAKRDASASMTGEKQAEMQGERKQQAQADDQAARAWADQRQRQDDQLRQQQAEAKAAVPTGQPDSVDRAAIAMQDARTKHYHGRAEFYSDVQAVANAQHPYRVDERERHREETIARTTAAQEAEFSDRLKVEYKQKYGKDYEPPQKEQAETENKADDKTAQAEMQADKQQQIDQQARAEDFTRAARDFQPHHPEPAKTSESEFERAAALHPQPEGKPAERQEQGSEFERAASRFQAEQQRAAAEQQQQDEHKQKHAAARR